MSPQVLNSGPGFLHVFLGIEEGVTHFLTIIGGKPTIHSFLSTGEKVATELNVPLVKAALQFIDNLVTGA